MPLPFLIPLILGAISAVGAVAGGIKGKSDKNEAESKIRKSNIKLENTQNRIEAKRKKIESRANGYGLQKEKMYQYLRDDFIPFFKKYKSVRFSNEGSDFSAMSIPISDSIKRMSTSSSSFLEIVQGALGSAGAGVGASIGTYALAGFAGTASTGTAIAGLSGAAATNATLAWLGGGTLAVGGAGIAGGTMLLLGGITAPISLLAGGLFYAHSASKELTKAYQYEAQADKLVANHKLVLNTLNSIENRIEELSTVSNELEKRLKKAVTTFRNKYKYSFFQKLFSFLHFKQFLKTRKIQKNDLMIIGALANSLDIVLSAPVLNEKGSATSEYGEATQFIHKTLKERN